MLVVIISIQLVPMITTIMTIRSDSTACQRLHVQPLSTVILHLAHAPDALLQQPPEAHWTLQAVPAAGNKLPTCFAC